MRKIPIIILIISLIFPVSGIRHEIYSEASPSDEGIYSYFTEILKDAEKCLKNFLDEELNVNLSVSLEQRVKLIEEESRFYAAKGLRSNVSIVVKPFLSLSSGIKKLRWSQSVFLENIRLLFENKNDYSAYLNARTAVINMRLAADEINNSLNKIELIELWNETSKLYFDVSDLKSDLEEVYDLIAYYESLLGRFEREGIFVAVSDDHPFLYQQITIYVYAKNVTPTSLFVDDIEYELRNNTMKYSFEELGEHTIYAEGMVNGKIVKSNVVKVYVDKIPTYIVLSSKSVAFLNENVVVTGYLSDFYGRLLQANVTVKIDGEETELTLQNGFFSFNVTKSSEGFLDVSAIYAGNETYEGSNASISIFFSRFPVSLYIEAEKTRVSVNETVEFTGKVNINYSIPIQVFVNYTDVKTLNATGEFNFTLNFSNPGTYIIFAYFPGDSSHRPAESNRIKIVVESCIESGLGGFGGQGFVKTTPFLVKIEDFVKVKYYFLWVIIVVAIIMAVSIILYKHYKRYIHSKFKNIHTKLKRKEGELKIAGEPEKVEVKMEEAGKKEGAETSKLKLPESVEDAYNILFSTLVSRYYLKRSLTPRELLKALKNEPFAEKLSTVTELHEKAVYGKMGLKDEEKEIYFKLITEILEEIR